MTSGEESDWGEQLEDFQPGRLGLSDSPHLVAWRFEDYPQEEQDSDSEEEDVIRCRKDFPQEQQDFRSEQDGLEENTSE